MLPDLFPATLLEQLLFLAGAFVLSTLIGIERQRSMKSAGVRTHALVGVGSALFTLVSAYGFAAVVGTDVQLDPSRIAAQIVSGIGFLGAGVIFVRRNAVSGLTTAASIWMTAAVGMACGAGMLLQASAATVMYLLIVGPLSRVTKRIPTVARDRSLSVQYKDGRGTLRNILAMSTAMGYQVALAGTQRIERPGKSPRVEANLIFHAVTPPPSEDLVEAIGEITGVVSVQARVEAD
ncbi:MgtC/SapB family protein [Microbacterium sp. NPDC057659]|uniref:MgtC/SapB family protein n=1 Tax=Microbacterium sp. NPDC057659 TaxID=3346198 RepID=UPI00366BA4E1